ncbi:MAG: hypothetical protein HKM07_02750 [Chlamydiae bacterium]|nr:hypothetical protein [Chlamydiota bacterium]
MASKLFLGPKQYPSMQQPVTAASRADTANKFAVLKKEDFLHPAMRRLIHLKNCFLPVSSSLKERVVMENKPGLCLFKIKGAPFY